MEELSCRGHWCAHTQEREEPWDWPRGLPVLLLVSPHHLMATRDSEQSGDTVGETQRGEIRHLPLGTCHIVEKLEWMPT